MNRAGLDMIRADSLDQVKGQCVYPLVVEEHREAFQELVQDVFQGKSRELEFRVIGLKGHTRTLYTKAVPPPQRKRRDYLSTFRNRRYHRAQADGG